MNLENPGLPPFEPTLSRLYDLAQTNGTSELEKRGYRLPDVETDASARRIFVRACHHGYDLAQRQVAAAVIDMEIQISDLNVTLKEQRRKRDSTAATALEDLIRTIRNRQITLRRLIDSILYAMIRQQNWLLRRFSVDLKIHNIDPIVLERTVQMAVDRNREDRMKFNLVCDLSTVIQIGDLMETDFTSKAAHNWKIIELKTGKMNEILSSSCALASSNEAAQSQELELLSEVPYFVDVADYNLNVSIADPIFSWPDRELIFDLLTHRISIFVQFDFEAFFRFAKKNDITIEYIKGKDAEPIKKFSRPLPGTDYWGILVRVGNGEPMTFLAGFVSRIYANFTTPRQLIKMIRNMKIDFAKSLKPNVPGLGADS